MAISQKKDKAFVESQILSFETELQAKGISNYFYTQRVCNGNTQMFVMPNGSTCFSSGNYIAAYVFWKEAEVVYGKQIDNCGLFETVSLGSTKFFDQAIKEFNTYQNKPVKGYMISRKKAEPTSRTKTDDCLRVFKFTKNQKSFKQHFKTLDLTTVPGEENINYQYNRDLEIVALNKKLDSIIPVIQTHKNYERQQ